MQYSVEQCRRRSSITPQASSARAIWSSNRLLGQERACADQPFCNTRPSSGTGATLGVCPDVKLSQARKKEPRWGTEKGRDVHDNK